MRAAQVLDYQRALRDGLRTGAYRRYLDQFLESVLTKSGWSGKDLRNRGEGFANTEIAVLERAYSFHVAEEMMPLIRHASTGLDEEVLWEKEVFPTDAGFLMFDDALVTTDLRQMKTTVSAITWRWGAGPDGRQPGVWFSMYSRWQDPNDTIAVELRERHGDAAMRRLGPLHVAHVVFVHWGHTLGSARLVVNEEAAAAYAIAGDPIEAGVEFDNPLRGIYATLALMGQTVTTVGDEEIPPGVARRMGKKRIPPRVVVIRLRHSAGSRQPGESMVEWAHRWVVRGHWRKQPYGQGNAKIRVIYIAPHVKGPEGKPLHISDKVYDLRR